jgi:hypothetical protein
VIYKLKKYLKQRLILAIFISGLFQFSTQLSVNAQEMPPRPIEVSIISNLSFGAFARGLSGGTVTIYTSGSRFSTGDITLLNLELYFPALFELEGNPGTIVHILNGPDEILNGNNGGSITLHLGEPGSGTPVILSSAPPGTTEVFIGGTLTIGNPVSSPSGFYSGSFYLTFIQE